VDIRKKMSPQRECFTMGVSFNGIHSPLRDDGHSSSSMMTSSHIKNILKNSKVIIKNN